MITPRPVRHLAATSLRGVVHTLPMAFRTHGTHGAPVSGVRTMCGRSADHMEPVLPGPASLNGTEYLFNGPCMACLNASIR